MVDCVVAMQIGRYKLDTPLVLAPMAGITDRPFRQICLQMGAGLAVSEMMLANPDTGTRKSLGSAVITLMKMASALCRYWGVILS